MVHRDKVFSYSNILHLTCFPSRYRYKVTTLTSTQGQRADGKALESI
jgi:hypothetical protein